MFDPLRHDESALSSETGREARIEELLLAGLDHYFKGQHELAINVWTRALFLDRSHARARAYIERARSALAEAQRESEELLQNGVAAFHRGEGGEARRLLLSAIDRGAPSEQALAVLERLNRLEAAVNVSPQRRTIRQHVAAGIKPIEIRHRSLGLIAAWTAAIIVVVGLAGYAAGVAPFDWLSPWLDSPAATAVSPIARDMALPLPRRGEMALARATALATAGRLRDALAALDAVRAIDPERPDADRLRGDIQRQLLAPGTAAPSAPRPSER